jgi:integrase
MADYPYVNPPRSSLLHGFCPFQHLVRLREAAPASVNVTVGRRSREYLTDREIERLIEAKQNRSGHRDATAILVAYRHRLRASELVALRWDDIDLATGRLHVSRAKSGDASVHPISARESRALRPKPQRLGVLSRSLLTIFLWF